MPNLLEGLISNGAASSGGALVPLTDSAVGTALGAEAGAAGTALGVGVGGAIGAAAIGAALGAGVACLTFAKDICGNPIGNGQYTWGGVMGMTGGLPIQYGAPMFEVTCGSGGFCVGSDPVEVATQYYKYSGSKSVSCSNPVRYGPGYTVTCQVDGHTYPLTVAQISNLVPSGGLSCGTDDFHTTTLASGSLSCSQAMPSTGSNLNPANLTTSMFSPSQLAEPANPDLIANIGNGLNTQLQQQSGSSTPPVNHPITGSMVQTVENQTGIYPTLQDLLAPLGGPSSVIATGADGKPTLNPLPTVTQLSNPTGVIQPPTSQQQQAAPCGNLLAGESDCSMTLDMVYNPETGCWEYMGGTALARTTSGDGCDQTPDRNKNISVLKPLQDLTTQIIKNALSDTDSATKTVTTTTNPLTSPKATLDTLTKTMDQTMTKTQEALKFPHPPPNVPIITLPFDEWPQVLAPFDTSPPDFSGQCPTVSFTVQQLRNTTFTFGAQCLVMDSLKPYMQYVLPPTYLFMALLWIMAA